MNTRSYIVSGIMGVAFLLVVSACTSESTSSPFPTPTPPAHSVSPTIRAELGEAAEDSVEREFARGHSLIGSCQIRSRLGCHLALYRFLKISITWTAPSP